MDQLSRLICWTFIKCRCPPLDVSHIAPRYILDVVNHLRVRAFTLYFHYKPHNHHLVHHFSLLFSSLYLYIISFSLIFAHWLYSCAHCMYTLPYVHKIQIHQSLKIFSIYSRKMLQSMLRKYVNILSYVHFTLCTWNTDHRFTKVSKYSQKIREECCESCREST